MYIINNYTFIFYACLIIYIILYIIYNVIYFSVQVDEGHAQ